MSEIADSKQPSNNVTGDTRGLLPFRGAICYGIILGILLWGFCGSVLTMFGGMPSNAAGGNYQLTEHGRITNVSHDLWISMVYMSNLFYLGAAITTVSFVTLLVAQKRKWRVHAHGQSYGPMIMLSVIVAIGMLACGEVIAYVMQPK